MIRDFIRFLWGKTSEQALIVIIDVACYLSDKDIAEAAEYLNAYHENRVRLS